MSWSIFRNLKRGHEQWKCDRHLLEKVVIGLDQALSEIDVLKRAFAGQENDRSSELNQFRGIIDQYKRDIEHRREVAPIRFNGFESMAVEIDRIGARLTQMEHGLNAFGDDGLWGCALAGTTLETMVDYNTRQ